MSAPIQPLARASSSAQLEERAFAIRRHVLDMAASPVGTHVGGSLSSAEILAVLYFAVLRLRPEEPSWPGRDRFVLSKGHSCAALYAALAEAGFITLEELSTYGQLGSRLGGHPRAEVPGIELPTGSLGHGLSLGVGMALAARYDDQAHRVFVLVGDGELQEGSIWEAAMAASHFGLGQLVAIVDRNLLQISGPTEECLALEPLGDRWRAFGWEVAEVDGHDVDRLREALDTSGSGTRPRVVVAHTIKGRGVPMFEGRTAGHYATLTPALHRRAVGGLAASYRGGAE